MMCVSNTPIAINVANKIKNYLNSNTLVIDLTTHDKNGTLKMNKIFQSKKISYNFCGVMGGPVQSEQGILGGIYGGKKNDFPKCKKYLNSFCKSVFNFGDVSKASSAKLLSNFLSLMTTTSVIEFFKSAKKLGINIKLLCDVARLGSGNSGALDRIANKAIKGNPILKMETPKRGIAINAAGTIPIKVLTIAVNVNAAIISLILIGEINKFVKFLLQISSKNIIL